MKSSMISLAAMLLVTSLSGCSAMSGNGDIASACENGIKMLDSRLSQHKQPASVQQTNIRRANSLLVAAKVQHQFAEYPGCLEKVKRAKNYLSGKQAAIISRTSI